MTGAKISVLLVEEQRLIFEGLSALLADHSDLSVTGVATTLADALQKAAVIKPDVVLMESRLSDGDGALAAAKIRATLPHTAILFLSADTSEPAMLRAVESGACGYLSKADTVETLVAGIRKAAAGEFLLEAATMARLRYQPSLEPVRPQ